MATKTLRAESRTNHRQPALVKSHIDLSESLRTQMCELLNQHLANTTDLYTQTKHAHWNVKGPDFMQLHELFDLLADGVEEYIDIIAERITALGGVAHGTTRMAAAASRLPETALGAANGIDYLKHLVTLYSTTAQAVRPDIDAADEAGDMGTSDLLIDVVRDLDKWRWFLEAHLQG
ncbi:MAG: DNA starvation/stationary phase protection protein Dps [Caldilineaceae bacterium]